MTLNPDPLYVEPEDPIPDRPTSGAVMVWIVLALGIAAVVGLAWVLGRVGWS